MANLRANKITSTEVFETTGSVQFDGTGDYLSLASNNDFDFSSGSFTIEAWVYPKSLSTDVLIATSNTTGGFFFGRRNSGAYIGYGRLGTAWDNSSGNDLVINQWNHVAVCRDSNSNIRVFLNGIQSGSTQTLSTSYNLNTLTIGGTTSNYFLNGHISNLRIIKGQALYTKNFTPPTKELTVIPNTVLLACQSTTNAAQEATGKTITVNGNAVANELTPGLLTDRVKSGGTSAIAGSVEFDGNDYLLESTGADGFNGGLGDWTVEAWMYCTDASQSDVLVNGLTSSTDRFYINFIGQTLYVGDFSINNIAIGGVKQINSWFHIAVTKSGSTYRAFINGVLIGSSTESLLNSTLTSLQIGYRGSQNYYTKGFISNLRVIKGTAVYTSNFIPPTRELKKLPGTVLLCCKNSSDPTAEETGKTITPYGNATARNFSPQVGFDGYVEFLGPTKINTPNYFYLPTGNTEDRGRGRGILAGGNTGSATNKIDYISIQSSGISQDFGDLNNTVSGPGGGVSSQTRGLVGGGIGPGATNINNIDYITIAVTSNAIDFGDLLSTVRYNYGSSSNTRGLWGGGVSPAFLNTIQYVTIASTGNAISFGSLTVSRGETGSCGSNTRCVWGGGNPSTNTVDYVTITSTGNAVDFGDLSSAKLSITACSSSIRGVWAGGYSPMLNVIEYLTIASTGNAVDFGDLSAPRFGLTSVSNSIRGVFCGGQQPSFVNTMEYVNISSTGNVLDFGDLYLVTAVPVGCSDSHGGLG